MSNAGHAMQNKQEQPSDRRTIKPRRKQIMLGLQVTHQLCCICTRWLRAYTLCRSHRVTSATVWCRGS